MIRNGAITKIFAQMNLNEVWGTWIFKIFKKVKDYGLREPELQDMGSDFRINLYRKEMMVDAYDVVDPKLSVKTDGSHIQNRNDFGTQSGTNGIILNGNMA